MSAETQAIFDAALGMDPVLRDLLAYRLLESLEEPGDEISDSAFTAELERRYQEYVRDPSCGVPWAEVKKKLQG